MWSNNIWFSDQMKGSKILVPTLSQLCACEHVCLCLRGPIWTLQSVKEAPAVLLFDKPLPKIDQIVSAACFPPMELSPQRPPPITNVWSVSQTLSLLASIETMNLFENLLNQLVAPHARVRVLLWNEPLFTRIISNPPAHFVLLWREYNTLFTSLNTYSLLLFFWNTETFLVITLKKYKRRISQFHAWRKKATWRFGVDALMNL